MNNSDDPSFLDKTRMVCKVLSNEPDRAIIALLKDENDYNINLFVFQIEASSGKVIRKLKQPVVTHQMGALDGIKIDTAAYRLAKDVRAFGVRVFQTNGSRVGNRSAEDLSLFVMQGQYILPVLSGMLTYDHYQDWSDGCEGTFTDIENTIAVKNKNNHSYADLVVVESTNVEDRKEIKEDCISKNKTTKKTYIIKFNGNTYVIPKHLKSMNKSIIE